MDESIKFFVGLDVHKDSIVVAVAEAGRAPARLLGTIAHDVAKVVKQLRRYGSPEQVQVVYEAGPTGYGLQRGNSDAVAKLTYERIYNGWAYAPCSNMPRLGATGHLTPEQITHLVAYLIDAASPINRKP